MLRQNGKRFYKGVHVTFKLAPDLKILPFEREGHVSILTNSTLRTNTSNIHERTIL